MNLALKTKLFLSRNNPEKIIEYLNNPQYDFDKIELLVSLKNPELVKICLKDDRLNFDSYSQTEVLLQYGDKNLVRECLKDKCFKFSFHQKVALIKETKDIELVKEYLQNEGKGEGKIFNKELIISTENYEFIEDCLFNEDLNYNNKEKIKLIVMTDNEKFIKKCLENEKLGFTKAEKIDMILGTENKSFIRKCFNDEKLGFDIEEKKSILLLSNDLELIKDWIGDKSIGFSSEQKVQLLVATKNKRFICKSLKDDAIDLNDSEKDILRNVIGIINKSKKQIEKEYGRIAEKKLKLPRSITIGMEIESEGFASEFLGDLFKYDKWQTVGDGSLEKGIEIKSPIIHSIERDSQEIYTITNVLKHVGQSVSERCGAHVHIGADHLTSIQSYKNLLELWCNNEKALYAMVNKKGEASRSGTVKYASTITPKMKEALENGTINLENEDFLDEFMEELKQAQGGRRLGINFMNVKDEKNTIEFRLANGTLDPELWIENTNLYGGMVAISEELAQIQKNGERTEEDKHKLEIFDKLKQDISEKEKVEFMLELVGVQPETYMERYETNIVLINENRQLQDMFEGKEQIDFKVAKEKFKGKESQKIQSSARAQIEARDNIVEGHERNLQNERDDRNYIH